VPKPRGFSISIPIPIAIGKNQTDFLFFLTKKDKKISGIPSVSIQLLFYWLHFMLFLHCDIAG